MKKLKLALLGTGKLNRIVAQAHQDGYLKEYELVGVLGNTFAKTQAFAKQFNTQACETIDQLMALEPDYTAEAASVQAVIDYSEFILNHQSNLILLSIGALADSDFYEKIKTVAQTNDKKVHIASGAVGGFDVLRTARLMGPIEVQMGGKKAPAALQKTPLYREGLLDITQAETVFEGTTAQAIKLLPTHLNVAIATALASAGPENTNIKVEALPEYVGDEHHIKLTSAEVSADLKIYSKTSTIAGWSIVAVLQNIVSPIVF